MKPTMMFAVIMIAVIILMTSFDLSLTPTVPIKLSESVAPNALFVCPAANSFWDNLSQGFQILKKPALITFLFSFMLLIVVWSWALYQNLLKDKFNRDAFKKPWAYTKLLFWAGAIVLLLLYTPNHFRMVRITGVSGEWVLCENNTPGARAVRAAAVHP
ncbi:MAG: hypothetical protein E7006_03055 [Alphaproteobacteria bacterium]|nr:hypothetical protein [Alphaproteobacteria bacterium]